MVMKDKIDIVITWVDGNDPEWLKERKLYEIKENGADGSGKGEVRFRDWDNLRYVFRGIERFMPWVHKVYFVTWGHLPKWLNTDEEKLVIVKHSDFIPEKYLPTFNSNTIDLNLFRIKGLEEQYIYFNDDMFVIKPVRPEDFFVNGRPKDMACISPQPIVRDSIRNIELNNLEIINDHFSIHDIRNNKRKWLNLYNYGSFAFRTFLFMRFGTIIGIFEPHIPVSHLRSTYEKLWNLEYKEFNSTCMNKIRTKLDINDWLARSWQLLSGEFEPRSRYFGKLVSASDIQGVREILWRSKYKMVCINDDDSVSAESFKKMKEEVNSELEKLLTDKCGFEK